MSKDISRLSTQSLLEDRSGFFRHDVCASQITRNHLDGCAGRELSALLGWGSYGGILPSPERLWICSGENVSVGTIASHTRNVTNCGVNNELAVGWMGRENP